MVVVSAGWSVAATLHDCCVDEDGLDVELGRQVLDVCFHILVGHDVLQ